MKGILKENLLHILQLQNQTLFCLEDLESLLEHYGDDYFINRDTGDLELQSQSSSQMLSPIQESLNKWIQTRLETQKYRRHHVSSAEYISWLYHYVTLHNRADDESALYRCQGKDSINGQLLSDFFDYVKELSAQQGTHPVKDPFCTFENEELAFRIKDKFFTIYRMFGQGSWTSVSLCLKDPLFYVQLPSDNIDQ